MSKVALGPCKNVPTHMALMTGGEKIFKLLFFWRNGLDRKNLRPQLGNVKYRLNERIHFYSTYINTSTELSKATFQRQLFKTKVKVEVQSLVSHSHPTFDVTPCSQSLSTPAPKRLSEEHTSLVIFTYSWLIILTIYSCVTLAGTLI